MDAEVQAGRKAQPTRMRRRLRLFLRMLAGVFCLLVLLFLLALLGSEVFILQLPFYLICGWIHYLTKVLPLMHVNFGMIFSGVAAFGLAVLTSHLVLRWFWKHRNNGQTWRWRWTTAVCLLVPVLFGISISVGGFVHQAAWLMHERRWVENVSMGRWTKNISNARQIITSLRIWASDHDGSYPDRLEQLFTDASLDSNRIFYYTSAEGDTPEMFVYLTGLNDSSPATVPLVIGPHSERGGKWVMGMNDSSVTFGSREDVENALLEWRKERKADRSNSR